MGRGGAHRQRATSPRLASLTSPREENNFLNTDFYLIPWSRKDFQGFRFGDVATIFFRVFHEFSSFYNFRENLSLSPAFTSPRRSSVFVQSSLFYLPPISNFFVLFTFLPLGISIFPFRFSNFLIRFFSRSIIIKEKKNFQQTHRYSIFLEIFILSRSLHAHDSARFKSYPPCISVGLRDHTGAHCSIAHHHYPTRQILFFRFSPRERKSARSTNPSISNSQPLPIKTIFKMLATAPFLRNSRKTLFFAHLFPLFHF